MKLLDEVFVISRIIMHVAMPPCSTGVGDLGVKETGEEKAGSGIPMVLGTGRDTVVNNFATLHNILQ